jgi:uncharacterized protein with NRDE domain
MCLVAWEWSPKQPQRLRLIANRDEHFDRPTQSLHWWSDIPILAGKDLYAGGTWLGLNRLGQLAVITNHRNPVDIRNQTPSRGELVAQFLTSGISAASFVEKLKPHAQAYKGFNLLLFDGDSLIGFENHSLKTEFFIPGIGAVSNASFNTPWPKVNRIKTSFMNAQQDASNSSLMSLLLNSEIAPDCQLPNTGVSLERERLLSPVFVKMKNYGTRASSIVRIHENSANFFTHEFNETGLIGESIQTFSF